MATYDVTQGEIIRIAGQVEGLANDYQTIYSDNLLNQLVSTELASAYTGTDGAALVNRINSYREAFAAMKQKMDDYAAHLRATAASYADVEANLAQEAAGIGR